MNAMLLECSRCKMRQDKVYKLYLKALGRPHLAAEEIEKMQQHVVRLARKICKHVWRKKFLLAKDDIPREKQ